MKRRFRILLCLLLIAALTLPLTGCGDKTIAEVALEKAGRTAAEQNENNVFHFGFGSGASEDDDPDEGPEGGTGADTEPGSSDSSGPYSGPGGSTTDGSASVKQLTIEDIQAMNESLVIDTYTNQGYLSTLVGKYYDKTVSNAEEGVESIKGLASLLGLTKGCEFFVVYYATDNDGYTYYTYQQRYGGLTLQYATLKIIIDPEGYTAGLTCSFVPNVGTVSRTPGITASQAEQVVRDRFSTLNLTYYPEHTVQLATVFNNQVYDCFVVYTNNPDSSVSFDMPYIEHYVTTDGSYLTPVPSVGFHTASDELMNNDRYFENLSTEQVNITCTLHDGSKKTVTVPVSKNKSDGKYYLIDPSRKIAVAKYKEFNFQGATVMVSSATQTGFSDNNVLAYDNYIKAYDFYAERGIRSINGFETPILITVGFCDQNGNGIDNACFYGINQGWACFAVSDVNRAGDALDVCGHEYTHGVTSQSMQGIAYRNEPGSINESYSDIMGNLCEMITGNTTDTQWLIGENAGKIWRSMSDPNAYQQPVFVGDEYYYPTVLNPDANVNDNGGVHANNSLIGHIAYLINEAGMTLDEQYSMWSTSIEMLTPLSDYQDLHAILLFSMKINGLMQKYGSALNRAFADAGLNDDWNETYLTATKAGCGRLLINTDSSIAAAKTMLLIADASSGTVVSTAFPDPNGVISVLLDAGTYITQFQVISDSYEATAYNYTGSGWSSNGNFGSFTITNGRVTELPSMSSGSSVPPSQTTPTQPQTPVPSSSGSLELETYNGGVFTMTIPKGWTVEIGGQYAEFWYKVTNPAQPSMMYFGYGVLSPFHKSESSRQLLSYYDSSGIIGKGPVLSEVSTAGVLNVWEYCRQFQIAVEGKALFPALNNIQVYGTGSYSGYYAGYGAGSGAAETVSVGTCTAGNGDNCIFTVNSALIDLDVMGTWGGNWFYTCYDLMGVVGPMDTYEDYLPVLLQCMASIQFSDSYIQQSQSSDYPLADNQSSAAGLSTIVNAMYNAYQQVAYGG